MKNSICGLKAVLDVCSVKAEAYISVEGLWVVDEADHLCNSTELNSVMA